MFCSQCGKKVTENMLFCPFCGKPIVIPDQEPEEAGSSAAPGREAEGARVGEAAARAEGDGETTQILDAPRQVEEAAARSERSARAEAPVRSGEGAKDGAELLRRGGEAAAHTGRLAREAAEASPRSEGAIRAGAEASGRSREEAQNGAETLGDLPERRESPQQIEARRAETDAAPRRGAAKGLQIDWEEEERFRPLDLDDMDPEPVHEEPENPREELSELLSHRLREEPVRLKGRAPDLSNVHNPDRPGASSRRKASSYAPVREFNPNDIFMDGDDYDEDDDDEEYAYEEPEEGGFFIRHIRGVVGLSLFVIVLAIVAGWAFSGGGQRVLAQANLAWQPSVYEKLGYDAYQNGQYAVAAGYYDQALKRDGRNYSYAYSAAVASYMAGDTERAAEMGKKAVEIDATRVDGYQLLQRLYPDASARPWEIQSLIQQGYRLTGDASLNDAPQQ